MMNSTETIHAKRYNRALRVFCAVITAALLLLCFPVEAFAASNNDVAQKAYFNWIKKNAEVFDQEVPVAFLDINNDGIKEMIVYPGYGYDTYDVYTFYKGKVKRLVSVGQAYESIKIYPSTKTLYFSGGHMGYYNNTFYKVTSSKATVVAKKTWQQDEGPKYNYKYVVKGMKVSKAKYDKFVKSLKKGSAKSHKSLTWNYYTSSGTLELTDYCSKATKTYYLAFSSQEAGTYNFYTNINPNFYKGYTKNKYTSKVGLTLCDSNKKPIGDQVMLKQVDALSYQLSANKVYYFKITTTNNKQSNGFYYVDFSIYPYS